MQQNGKTENEDFLAEAFTNEPKRENKPEDEEGLPLNQARLFGQRAENRPALALPGLTAMMAFLIALVTDLLTYSYRIGMQCSVQGLRELISPRRQIRHRNAQPRLRVVRQNAACPMRSRLALSRCIHAFANLDTRLRRWMRKIHPE